MGFEHSYRIGAHAVITNESGEVLLLKATYGSLGWSLPGGALDPGETIHECVLRECREELGLEPSVGHLTGVYLVSAVNAQVFIFRCKLPSPAVIQLSSEHSDYRYFPLSELGADQRRRVEDCVRYEGTVASAKF